ncbi:hypothetical protein COV53_03575 [Candidatus Gottesmanbacteria bacterium CG11_big_fil_rev_8_21_14_0_20_37_11]|uniref:SCP domain-containing protein n=3 Tax=Candidatus Gottesmaniibacteriota TaxID=1752720 RepID=A0A2M7RR62_9BACT|nr:MAG: hypothetical protein AUJ73_03560 [Candidatus Gottesmanbacteria bacterium CG1_02_37_22]PIP33278.1 MAG: hypothetical protein COX23_00270 [Candidatus Gottesmanbacteria bacterium CG23_combo_of_CG06-09_8_20_14_all_37_19]PIR08342.1 MAG: hypothetical protein COV53_03575 [Candidatus Gottesmanbacteria bacterium CG11_big_fil_rev_8_21_14_0_20_37_11]PIZ02762.1 MAG: hypothetical protein COY59_03085 [Candidatus Gottesmanbacteria bacterium CG_4_10_14_0_8_um_filter_37_24]
MNVPSLKGNWIDLIIILILLVYLFEGWKRGFILGLIDLTGFIISFIVALKLYSFIGAFLVLNFSLPMGMANALGFLLGGFIMEIIFTFLVQQLYRRFFPVIWEKLHKNGWRSSFVLANRLFGFIPAMGEALTFVAFFLTLIIVLPVSGWVKKDIISAKIGNVLVSKTQRVERQLNIIFGQAVNETLTFLTVNPNLQSNDKVELHFTQNDVKINEQAEIAMFDMVNKEREKNGLSRLILSTQLRGLARSYAAEMFAKGFFSHYSPDGLSPFDRMEKANIIFNAAGENLALAPNVELAHQGLMNSPGHKANILSPDFKKVGIGVIDGGIYGEMFVQEFTD